MYRRAIGATILAFTLFAAACGGDDDEAADDSETTTTEAEAENESTTTEAEESEDTTATTGDAATGAVTVQVAETSLGQVLVDAEGKTLYGFTADTAGTPTCAGGCAQAWPALLVEGTPTYGEGLDPAVFSTVATADGGMQLKAGEWPLYTFASDQAPGDVGGQGVGGSWYVVSPDGTLLQT